MGRATLAQSEARCRAAFVWSKIMAWSTRMAFWLVLCSIIVPSAVGDEPALRRKATVEFRWLEIRPIKDVTEEKGIRTTCGNELSFLHKKPILTGQDVASAQLRRHDLRANGLGVLFDVELHLTQDARQKLKMELGDNGGKELAVVIDGTYWGATSFKDKSMIDKNIPYAGFFSLKSEAERIVEAVTITISATNAHQVRSVKEVPRRANRIMRGPQRGELTLLDGTSAVEVVDDVNLRTLRTIVKDHRPADFAASPDGKRVIWTEGDRKSYTVQETDDGAAFDIEIGKHPGRAAFSPDGKLLAIGFTYWDPNAEGVGYSEMRLFDLKGKLLRTLEKNGPGAIQPVFSPDGKRLAIGNRNYETQLFDVATGELLHKLDKRMTQEVAFSPDGEALACGYVDGTVAIWDVATGKLRHSAPSGCKEIYSVDWSPKGDVLATSGRNGKVILWDPRQLARLKELDAPFWVIQVRFTADGSRMLTASAADYAATKDRKITVWAVADDERPRSQED